MTKRFELVWKDTGEVLHDNETGHDKGIYSPDYRFHVRDMMNELSEENEQLKARIGYLERKIQRERTSAMKEHEKWEKEIQKENEQLNNQNQRLKEQNNKLRKVSKYYDGTVGSFKIGDL